MALPSRAVTHIQNTAPVPPRQMAVEMPAMLPVPTREAVDTIRAWKEEMEPALSGFSPTTRMDSANIRNWMNLVRKVKYRPTASSRMISR